MAFLPTIVTTILLLFTISVNGFTLSPRSFHQQKHILCNLYLRQICLGCTSTSHDIQEALSPQQMSEKGVQESKSPLEKMSDNFVEAWLKGFEGKLGPMKALMPDEQAPWVSPVANTNGDMKSQFINFADFFLEPALTIFNRRIDENGYKIILDYQLSFWYPLPWRPRIIVPGKAIITTNTDATRVLGVSEEWETTIPKILLKQAFPRLWDIWHIFSTPGPEYPPILKLGNEGKVVFSLLPPSIALEATWTGPAKFPGPPLLTMPGFALFGELRTSRPNRDKFYCTMPVESCSDTFVDETNGIKMKKNTFMMHVPSALHNVVAKRVETGEAFTLLTNEQQQRRNGAAAEEQDDEAYTSDVQVGISDEKLSNLENISLMKSVTGGNARGQYDVNQEIVEEFVASEHLAYRYRSLPRRVMAQVAVKGEVTSEKVKRAVEEIKKAVQVGGGSIDIPGLEREGSSSGTRYSLRTKGGGDSASPLVGFQMYSTKACFNMQGEPAMAIYEIQFDKRETNVQVELVPQQQ